MTFRGCIIPFAAFASVTKTRWIGCSTFTSAAMSTTAPSCMNAVLSAVKACVSAVASDPMRPTTSGASVHAVARSSRRTPAGSVSQSDSSRAKRPLTNTIVCQSLAPNVNGASAARVTSPLGETSGVKSCSTIGATLV